MTTHRDNAAEENRIRVLLDGWVNAIRVKDLSGVMSAYAPDALAFDLAPPLQHSADSYRRGLEAWFPTFVGEIGYEMRDLSVTVGGDVAYSHSLNRISGKRNNGEQTDVWVRATVCLRKIGGKWKIAHEHVSVPFYMDGSFRAAVDLRP